MSINVKQENGFSFVEEGEGEVLILLHGLFGALSNWEYVLGKFSSRYKVVIPLMPIYDLPLLGANVDALAKFIHKFLEYKKFGKVTLLGNSLGGHVGLVYTLAHPERVHSMMLTGSSGLYEEGMGGTYPRREDYNYIKERVEYTFFDPKTATKDLVDEVFEVVNNRSKILRILSMAKSAMRHNLRKEIPKITIPVSLIWGANDTITPPEVGNEFHTLFPNSELTFIKDCGHAAMMERPEEFNEILDTWLNKVYPK
jgi:pimeloyl-ACP methyl ester carboxylesterase